MSDSGSSPSSSHSSPTSLKKDWTTIPSQQDNSPSEFSLLPSSSDEEDDDTDDEEEKKFYLSGCVAKDGTVFTSCADVAETLMHTMIADLKLQPGIFEDVREDTADENNFAVRFKIGQRDYKVIVEAAWRVHKPCNAAPLLTAEETTPDAEDEGDASLDEVSSSEDDAEAENAEVADAEAEDAEAENDGEEEKKPLLQE
jgi:hypothetical protein